MTPFTRDDVLKALRTVNDPDLKRDLVSLNMIQGLELNPESGSISLRVVLTTPACPLKAKIEADVRSALQAIPGIKDVNIKMEAEVRGKSSSSNRIPGVENIIAVSSGKGGVGKSTVAVNLATGLAAEGARVGLMDADVYGPNLPTMMGVISQPQIRQDSQRGEVFVPPEAHGVKVMSMGFLTQGDQPLVWRGPMLHSVVNQFCHKVEWGNLDYLVVDMPPGTGDVQLSLAQLVPVTGAVLVTTPQEVSMQDVRKAFYMFEKVRVPVLGIIENMSSFSCDGCGKRHFLFGEGGGKRLAKKFNVELLAEIPLVTRLREAGDEGHPVALESIEVGKSFRELSRKVAQQVSIYSNAGVDPSQIVQLGRFQ